MTFSYSIKTELCDFARRDITNQKACLYGMLMFSRQFSITNISLHTEHEEWRPYLLILLTSLLMRGWAFAFPPLLRRMAAHCIQ